MSACDPPALVEEEIADRSEGREVPQESAEERVPEATGACAGNEAFNSSASFTQLRAFSY